MIKLYVNLKKLREELGFTQNEMANKLGYSSKSTYNMKEKGVRRVTVEEAYVISKLFKKPIEEIFFEPIVAKKATKLDKTG